MRRLQSGVLLAAIACLTAGPSAQGLADLARRGSTPPPQGAKTYTNDDVEVARPAAPRAAAADSETAVPEEPKAEPAKATLPGGEAPADEAQADEPGEPRKPAQYVLNRIAELKSRLATKQKQLSDLQARDAQADVAIVQKQVANLQKELATLELGAPAPRAQR